MGGVHAFGQTRRTAGVLKGRQIVGPGQRLRQSYSLIVLPGIQAAAAVITDPDAMFDIQFL